MKLADKVAEREYLMKEIEYTLNTETNPERKSALEKLQSTIYADERVRVLVRKEWRYDTVVETSRAISARMFHVGENILKKNPDISSQEMKNQMITVFKQE